MAAWLRLGKALDRLGDALVALSAVLLLLMVVLMGVEIGARGVLRMSTQIADEYSGYLFTWVTLCGFLYAQRNDRFLRVDSLRTRLTPRRRAAMDGLASLFAGAVAGILMFATWSTFQGSLQFGTVSLQPSQTPLYLPQAVMPAGFALLLVAFVQSAIHAFLQAAGRAPLQGDSGAQAASHE